MAALYPTTKQMARIAKATRRCNIIAALDELSDPDSVVTGASRTEMRAELLWELAILDGIAAPTHISLTTGSTPALFPRIWRVLLRNRYRAGQATVFSYNTIR